MTQSKNWIIYEHISPSGKIYVGITSYSVATRWGTEGHKYLSKSNSRYLHPIFAKAILKYGWNNFKHIIIASNLGEMTAKNMEKDLIAFNKAKGISYNITDGGDGVTGIYYSARHKEQISISLKNFYKKHGHPLKGFKHNDISKKRMSESQKSLWTPEYRESQRRKHYKPIIAIDSNRNRIDFESTLTASRELNVPTTSIWRHLKSGKPYKGYIFYYLQEYIKLH